jgi:hypothetical protein
MDKNTSKYFAQLKNDQKIFLNFLKAKFPLFHNSNFFFRDFHYGIIRYFEKKGVFISYQKAEMLANELAMYFESQGLFIRTNGLGWKINYPEFTTQTPGDPFK